MSAPIAKKGLMVILIGLALVSGCKPDQLKAEKRRRSTELLAIKIENGISKTEAEKILRFYFDYNISGCGYLEEPVDDGEFWSAHPRIGLVGARDPNSIRVHKRTGAISWNPGPTYNSIAAMTKSALTPEWIKALGGRFDPPLA